MDKAVTAHLSKHDREIDAIRKLVHTGMKMLVRMERPQHQTDRRLDRLVAGHETLDRQLRQQQAAGRDTDRRLDALIRTLTRGGNGRGPSSH